MVDEAVVDGQLVLERSLHPLIHLLMWIIALPAVSSLRCVVIELWRSLEITLACWTQLSWRRNELQSI